MSCNHCRENVENSVRSAEGVKGVNVDLATGRVDIEGEAPDIAKIKEGIKGIGYQIID
jgi:copper chaperone CopZ